MKIFIALLIYFPLLALSQNEKGVLKYETIVKYYRDGAGKARPDTSTMPSWAREAREEGDPDVALKIVKDYVGSLKEEDLLSQPTIEFLVEFMEGSKDDGFRILFHHASAIDRLMKVHRYAEVAVERIIAKEEIDPVIYSLDSGAQSRPDPDWNTLKSTIAEKYGTSYAQRTIADAKVRWYSVMKKWPKFCSNTVDYVEMYGPTMGAAELDGRAWSIFQHSTNQKELNAAISWMKRVLSMADSQPGPDTDTYANLLYKTGNKEKAIKMEENAVTFAESKHDDRNTEEFKDSLEKMRSGLPTWSQD